MLLELAKPGTKHKRNQGKRNQLAKAWIALQTTPQNSSEYHSLFWSFEQTYDLVREDPEEAWNLILAIWSLDQSTPAPSQSCSAITGNTSSRTSKSEPSQTHPSPGCWAACGKTP
jgi:hypothetical protein